MNIKKIIAREGLTLVGIAILVLFYAAYTRELNLPVCHPNVIQGIVEFFQESLWTQLSATAYFAVPFYSVYILSRIILWLTGLLKKIDAGMQSNKKIIILTTREILIFLAFFFPAGSLATLHQADLMDAEAQMAVFWRTAALVAYPLFQIFRIINWVIKTKSRRPKKGQAV